MKLLIFLYMAPGNYLAERVGATDEHERGLIRSLVNTLLWTTAGAPAFFAAAPPHGGGPAGGAAAARRRRQRRLRGPHRSGGRLLRGRRCQGHVRGEGAEGAAGPGTFEQASAALRSAMECSRWLHQMPKPTLASLPGAAAGAALSMALACDLRIAAAGAKLTTAFAGVALSGDFGGSYFLSRLVGTGKARELYYLGDVILAEEALRLGVVNWVVPPEALAAETMAVARRLADGPRAALSYMKRNLNAAEDGGLEEIFEQEAFFHTRSAMMDDHAEAALAFTEKRAPRFTPP